MSATSHLYTESPISLCFYTLLFGFFNCFLRLVSPVLLMHAWEVFPFIGNIYIYIYFGYFPVFLFLFGWRENGGEGEKRGFVF